MLIFILVVLTVYCYIYQTVSRQPFDLGKALSRDTITYSL